VEAILDGHQPKGLRLAEILGNALLKWEEQRATWGFDSLVTTQGVIVDAQDFGQAGDQP
jgi:hypothetical protein